MNSDAEQALIQATADYVRGELESQESAHDWFHIERVWKNARLIAAAERKAGAEFNELVVELAALLHDIADYKFHGGDEKIGGETAAAWLQAQSASPEIVQRVVEVIDTISFKGPNENHNKNTLEAKIVSDADKLDAIGAVGIARCFAYGGAKGRVIYDPDIKPNLAKTKEQYKTDNPPSINHFYKKLLLLKDIMQTETGKNLAQARHKVLEDFLEQFFAEWNGER